jgi:hypothetical protein
VTVRLSLPFVFACGPGEEKRVSVIAYAPLPAPMAQRMNLDRIVALSSAGLDDWEITALRVMDGQRVGDIISAHPTAPWTGQGPVPAAVFSCVAIGTEISAPFAPGDTLTCAARNKGATYASLSLAGIVPGRYTFLTGRDTLPSDTRFDVRPVRP